MSHSVDRRGFLALSAAAGVSLQAAGSGSAADSAADRIIVGVMGTGGRGTSLAGGFQRLPNVEVGYVCDVDPARAGRAGDSINKISGKAPRVVSDFRRILDDKAVNVLVCAACNHWHGPATILACAAGKHVYVEKPCSHNPREGELMIQAARKHDRRVQMGNQRRSSTGVIQAMAELKKGTIGRVYLAESWYNANRPSIGRSKGGEIPKGLDYDLWQGPAPGRPFHSNYLPYNWHWFWHWGNGELGNNGVHMIDLCRWGLGVDYPIRVVSSGGRYRWDDDQETPDTHEVSFEFEGKKQVTWHGLSCSRQPVRPYHSVFHGEQGTLALSDKDYTIFDRAGKELRREKVQLNDAAHFSNFLDAIRNKTPLHSEIEEAHKSTLLCHLGNIAHRTGRALRSSPKDGSIQKDEQARSLWTREYEKGWEPRV